MQKVDNADIVSVGLRQVKDENYYILYVNLKNKKVIDLAYFEKRENFSPKYQMIGFVPVSGKMIEVLNNAAIRDIDEVSTLLIEYLWCLNYYVELPNNIIDVKVGTENTEISIYNVFLNDSNDDNKHLEFATKSYIDIIDEGMRATRIYSDQFYQYSRNCEYVLFMSREDISRIEDIIIEKYFYSDHIENILEVFDSFKSKQIEIFEPKNKINKLFINPNILNKLFINKFGEKEEKVLIKKIG